VPLPPGGNLGIIEFVRKKRWLDALESAALPVPDYRGSSLFDSDSNLGNPSFSTILLSLVSNEVSICRTKKAETMKLTHSTSKIVCNGPSWQLEQHRISISPLDSNQAGLTLPGDTSHHVRN
jgi:hypothetical protein